MDNDVKYCLDNNLREDIAKVKNKIVSKLINANVFLFGSIAKGRYRSNSDIDLLILINLDKTTRELRVLRHELEDAIDELNIDRDVDIKLYTIKRYEELCNTPCFEKAILEDLIDIRGW